MTKELLMSSNYWVLNKSIVKEYGIETALILTVMAEAENMLADDEGWFYQTADTIEELTGLSNHKQSLAIKQLVELGVLEQSNKGMPMKRYFKLSFETIENQVFKKFKTKDLKNLKASFQNFSKNKELSNKQINKKLNNSSKAVCEFFDSIWSLYPNKQGKGKVSATQQKKLLAIGYAEIAECIERYKRDKPDWQKYQNGSTFFNSGYVDYLDENYQLPEEENSLYLGHIKDGAVYI